MPELSNIFNIGTAKLVLACWT